MAAQGAVAAGHPETAKAAADILKEGGNAFDAVIGGVLAACVAEPVLASLGGGGFCLAAAEGRDPVVYDFFAHTPKARPDGVDFFPIIADFGTAQQEFHIGMGSIATPGVVRGLFALHREHGAMPLRDIVAPAMALARGGVTINALQAYIFRIVQAIYLSNDICRARYGSAQNAGAPIGEGEILAMPDYADMLDALSREGEDLFYRGEIAARIARDCAEGGGCLTRQDFESYKVERRVPLKAAFDDATIHVNPPPSTGGLLIAFALKLLEGSGVARDGFGSKAHLEHLVAAMTATNQARLDGRLHEKAAADMAGDFLDETFLGVYRDQVQGHPRAHRGTTHISVVDGVGNVAALTLSNGEGAAYIVPGTGVMLNNMLGEEDINPHGWGQWPRDVRMSSMMAPMMLDGADGSRTVLGSGGSNRIRTAILQTVLNMVVFGLPLDKAVQAPRVHADGATLSIENGFDADVLAGLALPDGVRQEIWQDRNFFFGGVHAVRMDPATDACDGVGDPRRGGAAVVV